MTVGAVLIVQDEELDLPACLQSLQFCDEVVVVDGGSQDRTCEIALGFANVRLFSRPFDSFSAQWSYAIERSTTDWFLQIAADERVPKFTADEVRTTAEASHEVDALRFGFNFYAFGSPLQHGGYESYREVRFVRRTKYAGMSSRTVHEHLLLADNAIVRRAVGRLIHLTYATREECFMKSERYAAGEGAELKCNLRPDGRLYLLPFSLRQVVRALAARGQGRTVRELLRSLKNQRPSRATRYIGPPAKFFFVYVVRRGFLDGRSGLYLAYMQGRYIKRKYDFALGR